MLVKAKSELQAIAANRLLDGTAVWLGADHRWVEDVGLAGRFHGAEIERALDAARRDVTALRVVDVYPLDVVEVEGRTVPTHSRERMKALGPSVRPDLGKQATQREIAA